MRRRFHKPNSRQLHLLPVSIDQWVYEEHLAQFLWECAEHFNLKQFYAAYGGVALVRQFADIGTTGT